MLSRKPVLPQQFLKFIEETYHQLTISLPDSFQYLQPLRYALASILRYLAPEFVDAKAERFDNRIHKGLFDLLLTWSEDSGSSWGHESSSDNRREIERYKSNQYTRSLDKFSFDREMTQQLAMNWVSMNIMPLLYGPCFDDNARKMSGRFQYKLSSRLAKDHPDLSEYLCKEIMHQVLAPWIENLNFVRLKESGWSERLLNSLYYVTWKHGDQFPDDIEKLWKQYSQYHPSFELLDHQRD
ncbi:ARM repeat superfamily protein [Zea mays]|uniref:ARM repeat superfamily protein n=1 Tax=Zea mays TaxID=4577 RepID=A0A1D6HQ91_MAIZE|nr:ARM repeat superfamily protein [Zea mays]